MIISSMVTGYICNQKGFDTGETVGISKGLNVNNEDNRKNIQFAYDRGVKAGQFKGVNNGIALTISNLETLENIK